MLNFMYLWKCVAMYPSIHPSTHSSIRPPIHPSIHRHLSILTRNMRFLDQRQTFNYSHSILPQFSPWFNSLWGHSTMADVTHMHRGVSTTEEELWNYESWSLFRTFDTFSCSSSEGEGVEREREREGERGRKEEKERGGGEDENEGEGEQML